MTVLKKKTVDSSGFESRRKLFTRKSRSRDACPAGDGRASSGTASCPESGHSEETVWRSGPHPTDRRLIRRRRIERTPGWARRWRTRVWSSFWQVSFFCCWCCCCCRWAWRCWSSSGCCWWRWCWRCWWVWMRFFDWLFRYSFCSFYIVAMDEVFVVFVANVLMTTTTPSSTTTY